MNINEKILMKIDDLIKANVTPTEISLDEITFRRLKDEVEQLTNVKVNDLSNHFCGIPIVIYTRETNFIDVRY